MDDTERLDSEVLNLYLNEVNDFQHELDSGEEQILLNEVEQVTDFLQKVGLSNLSEIYLQGCEISETIVNATVSQKNLTRKQAQTVRSRVKTLNKTLRSQQPRTKYRQDVRDMSWKAETSSTGTGSRSITPDSLTVTDAVGDLSVNEEPLSLLDLPLDAENQQNKTKSKWLLDEQQQNKVLTKYERGDIAHLLSETVVLKGYHPIGELRPLQRNYRERSDSDPSSEVCFQNSDNCSLQLCEAVKETHSNSAISKSISVMSDDLLSFEGLIQRSGNNAYGLEKDFSNNNSESNLWIDDISDSEYQFLRPFLWVEITALFDQYNISILKRKATTKNKRGKVFGVKLSTLIMRDMPRSTDSSMVPQIFLSVLNQLNTRCLKEDGILRVGGQKQKIDKLCREIEAEFYSNRSYVESLLNTLTAHELVGILKKLLRDLPDPIFTMELFDMFYKCHLILSKEDQFKAFNILILLLPVEHRNTFRILLNFLINVIKHEKENHMSLHNVAMVVAPSFFPPRLLLPKENKDQTRDEIKENLINHISDAAVCCCIMETLLRNGNNLWLVPADLVDQARKAQTKAQDRREQKKESAKIHLKRKKLQRSSTQYHHPGIMISPRINHNIFM